MTRALILAAVVTAFAAPTAVLAENNAPRPQTQAARVQRHATQHLRVPGTNHAPNVTFKRGVTGALPTNQCISLTGIGAQPVSLVLRLSMR